MLTAGSPLAAGCKPAKPTDDYWDYPDRINAAGVRLKQTPPTSLRGYLFWTSDTEACLRVDLRTLSADKLAGYGIDNAHLGVQLVFDESLQPAAPLSRFRFEAVDPGRVYSVSLPVACSDKSRSKCRTVWVSVAHPKPGPGVGITIELLDG